ncbi:CBS domain-containing protein [Rosettibacter firmus]|uniref:CBS domain-containing protein n=1 Tax=Rosettibacter firmus TaxID=3111522 RepID=UPI00336BBA86
MKSIKQKILTKSILTVKSGTSIYDTVLFMAKYNIGLVPVLSEDGKLLGVFSERDLVRRVIANNLDLKSTTVDTVMSKDLVLADINETYEECLKKMKDRGTRHILVIENDKLVGILSIRDLLEIDLKVQKETIEVLHNYIYSK